MGMDIVQGKGNFGASTQPCTQITLGGLVSYGMTNYFLGPSGRGHDNVTSNSEKYLKTVQDRSIVTIHDRKLTVD